MKWIWGNFLTWLRGRKAILGGVFLMAAAIAGVWFGKLDPVTGLTLLGTGLSVAGFGDKMNRHQSELLTALQAVAAAGANRTQANNILAKAAADVTVAEIRGVVDETGASE